MGWTAEDEQSHLNELGQRGWELVAVVVKLMDGHVCSFHYLRKEINETDNSSAENVPFTVENKRK